MADYTLNFSFGTNELPELRAWQQKWKRGADQADFYSIAGFQGVPALQKAIYNRFESRGVRGGLSPRQVMVTSGGTEAIFTSFLWLKSLGGTVILQHPSWGYFTDTLKLLDIPFIYSTSLTSEELKDELNALSHSGPFLFLLTHPSNPFSFVFPRDYLQVLSDWVYSSDTNYVLSDEIYDWYMTSEDNYISWSTLHGLDQSIIVHGYSKATGLAGFRIGYLLADTALYKGLFPFHYSSSYGAALYSQYMALEAQADEEKISRLLDQTLTERWDILNTRWKDNPWLKIRDRKAGMYAYIDIEAPVASQKDFVSSLKSEAGVWVNPGWNFGVKEGGFRMNLCRPEDTLSQGIDLILKQAEKYFSK